MPSENNMENLFFLEFILNKNCNKQCSYCDLLTKGITTKAEIDIDYIDWLINNIPTDNLFIELTGGEPGLVSNLPEIVQMLKSANNVKRIQLMSNGLVRINYPDLIAEVDMYNEHFIDKIVDSTIKTFYPIEIAQQKNIRNVVVLDKVTTVSILENYEYFEQFGLFNEDNYWLKMFVPRSNDIDAEHIAHIIKLCTKLDTNYSNFCKQQLTTMDDDARLTCMYTSFLPSIDIEDKKILHCAYHNFTDRYEYECTSENLDRLINKTLFKDITATYCEDCYLYYTAPEFLKAPNKQNRRAYLPADSNSILYI